MTEKKKTQEGQMLRFTPQQLASSYRYADKKDLICALFDDAKTYTLAETEAAIAGFEERKVN